jgi:hypothetical protein
MGYAPRDISRGVTIPIIDADNPMASLREPTDGELKSITADLETKRVMRIVKLGQAAAAQLRERCIVHEAMQHPGDDDGGVEQLLPGIWGVPKAVRLDDPNQLNVSISSVFPGMKVGDHIDEWSDPNVSFMIANMGPGERWHRVAPDLNRDIAGGAGHDKRASYLNTQRDPATIPLHWFKLAAPQEGYVEAIFNSPVAWAMHEGSTLGGELPSEAVMCTVETANPSPATYPSVV